jgi:hypothetical protein
MDNNEVDGINSREMTGSHLVVLEHAEDLIATMNTFLSVSKTSAVHFYPTQIEEIANVLTDLMGIMNQYAEAYEAVDDIAKEEKSKNEEWANLFSPGK